MIIWITNVQGQILLNDDCFCKWLINEVKLKSLAVTETSFGENILLLQKIIALFLEFDEFPRVEIYKMKKKITLINIYEEKIKVKTAILKKILHPKCKSWISVL